MKKFGKLSQSEKDQIIQAQKEGKLEVNCPWWDKNHWEEKKPETELWEECYYRIKKS